MGTVIEGFGLALAQVKAAEDEIDLAALVANYSALLYRVAHSVVRSPAEAEDIVQDTFVRVLEHRRRLPEIREMRVWLVRITWNLALDRRRRIRPDQMDEFFAAQLTGRDLPADIALRQAQETTNTLREIDRLPPAEKQALVLSAMEDLSTAEIAAILNKSESAVRALLFRARSRLKERLAQRERKGGKA